MMFSILPYDYTDAGLTGQETIKIKASIVAFDARTDVIFPERPVAAVDPDAASTGASTLVGSFALSMAAVAMSLY